MNEDLETQVKELRTAVDKNTLLLKKINRREAVSFWARMIFILIIIGGSYYSYVKFLAPVTQNLYGSLSSLEESIGSISSTSPDLLNILDFLNTNN